MITHDHFEAMTVNQLAVLYAVLVELNEGYAAELAFNNGVKRGGGVDAFFARVERAEQAITHLHLPDEAITPPVPAPLRAPFATGDQLAPVAAWQALMNQIVEQGLPIEANIWRGLTSGGRRRSRLLVSGFVAFDADLGHYLLTEVSGGQLPDFVIPWMTTVKFDDPFDPHSEAIWFDAWLDPHVVLRTRAEHLAGLAVQSASATSS